MQTSDLQLLTGKILGRFACFFDKILAGPTIKMLDNYHKTGICIRNNNSNIAKVLTTSMAQCRALGFDREVSGSILGIYRKFIIPNNLAQI